MSRLVDRADSGGAAAVGALGAPLWTRLAVNSDRGPAPIGSSRRVESPAPAAAPLVVGIEQGG
jgi:membrane-bound lytic murein transglycosylase